MHKEENVFHSLIARDKRNGNRDRDWDEGWKWWENMDPRSVVCNGKWPTHSAMQGTDDTPEPAPTYGGPEPPIHSDLQFGLA